MNKQHLLWLAAGLWMTAASHSQEGLHITFDGPPEQPPGTSYSLTNYVESGVWFTPIPHPPPWWSQFGRASAPDGPGYPTSAFPDDGSAYLIAALGESLRFRFNNGSLFDLLSVKLGEFSTLYQEPLRVHFVGYHADGSTVTLDLTTDGIIDGTGPLADFETFSFAGTGFTNLARVEIPSSGWALDDLVVRPTYSGLRLVTWGGWDNLPPWNSLPPAPTNAIAIASGGPQGRILALRPDGTVRTWGVLYRGQETPPDLSRVVAMAAGRWHSVALLADGALTAWGTFQTPTNVLTPPPGLNNVIALAAGDNFTLALRADRKVVQWPTNEVPEGLHDVVAVAAHYRHSLALRSDGTVVAWGDDSPEWASVSAASPPHSPLEVPAGLTGVVAVAAGHRHSLALLANGRVVAWGNNLYGQTEVPPDLTNAVAIAAGWDTSFALRRDGTVVAWGDNGAKETNVPPGLTNVVAIVAQAALVGQGPPLPYPPLSDPQWSDGEFSVTVAAESGHVYRLEYRESLTDGQWTPLPLAPGHAGKLVLVDPSPGGSQRFYRVRRW